MRREVEASWQRAAEERKLVQKYENLERQLLLQSQQLEDDKLKFMNEMNKKYEQVCNNVLLYLSALF